MMIQKYHHIAALRLLYMIQPPLLRHIEERVKARRRRKINNKITSLWYFGEINYKKWKWCVWRANARERVWWHKRSRRIRCVMLDHSLAFRVFFFTFSPPDLLISKIFQPFYAEHREFPSSNTNFRLCPFMYASGVVGCFVHHVLCVAQQPAK